MGRDRPARFRTGRGGGPADAQLRRGLQPLPTGRRAEGQGIGFAIARDGHDADNTIAILVKDVASALDAAPDGADTSLPRLVQSAIHQLKPRLG